MEAQKRHFLVDFENVGLPGLEGAQTLTDRDYVWLFSTNNAARIDTATLALFNATNLKTHEVPQKKQSVDMHLVSWLGFLIAQNGASASYTIVSNDTDYDNIIAYWKARQGVDIRRQGRLHTVKPAAPAPAPAKAKPTPAKPAPAPAKAKPAPAKPTPAPAKAKPAPAKPAPAPAKAKPAPAGGKSALNTAVQQALGKAKYDNAIVSFAASQAVRLYGQSDRKQRLHQSLVGRYGQQKGSEIYGHIKKLY